MIKLKHFLSGFLIFGAFSCNQEEANSLKTTDVDKCGNLISYFSNSDHNDLEYVNSYLTDLKHLISPKLYNQFIERLRHFNDADKIHIIRYLHFSEHFYFDGIYQDFIYKFSFAQGEVLSQVLVHIRKVSQEPLFFENLLENIDKMALILDNIKADIKAIADLLNLD